MKFYLILTLLVIISGAAMAQTEPEFIYGFHDPGGESNMASAKGYIVFTEEIGSNPAVQNGGNYSSWYNAGYGVIVRLNNGYGSAGTIPVESQYGNFATRVANYIKNSTGVHYWIIGNETNLPREWPGNVDGNPATGEPITSARYVNCYIQCYNAVKAVAPNAKLIPSPSGTWSPPWPGQGIEGFLDYWINTLNGIGASRIDALAIHAYTHGCDPALVTSNAKMGPPYQDIYYNFRVYQNYMNAIPASMKSKAIYITECNMNIECADTQYPKRTWPNVNNGWVRAIYAEINNWNLNNTQKIRTVALFRWPLVQEGEFNFGIADRTNVIQDFQQAVGFGYRWNVGPGGSGTEIIVDNLDPGFSVVSGTWSTGTLAGGYPTNAPNYRFNSSGTGSDAVRWTANLPESGNYEVFVWYLGGGNRANNAPFTVNSLNGSTTVSVNQQQNSAQWRSIGTFPFAAGNATITLSDQAGPSVVMADAVRFLRTGSLPATGSVSGFVRDQNSNPVSGATVATSAGGYSTTTASDGSFTLSSMAAGTYNITATRSGYTPQTVNSVVVGLGAVTQNFTLQQIEILKVESTVSSAATVARGMTLVPLQITLRNTVSRDVRALNVVPTFKQGATDVTSHFTATLVSAIPDTIVPGGTVTANYNVLVKATAPFGLTTLQATVTGYENYVPNGSFEQSATLPPPFWTNWNTGGSYILDTEGVHGLRSYRFQFTNEANDKWVTASTAPHPVLIPILPGKQYSNRVRHKRSVSSGASAAALVFEQYDAAKNKIGSDEYYWLPTNLNWTEYSVTRTTAANAAFYRTWIGFQSQASNTTASGWFDDVRLYEVGVTVTDQFADSADTWNVVNAQSIAKIGSLKSMPDGAIVLLTGKSLTKQTANRSWVQEPDRSAAIRVEGSHPAAAGQLVDVVGTLSTIGNERVLTDGAIVIKGPGSPPRALSMNSASVIGPDVGANTPGMDDPFATGVNTVGLLVRVHGKVNGSGAGFFYLDDGIGITDGSGFTGLRIELGGSAAIPVAGTIVKVTGIAKFSEVNGQYVRSVYCNSAADITTLNP